MKIQTGQAQKNKIVYLEEHVRDDRSPKITFTKKEVALTRVFFDPRTDKKARAKFVSAVLGRPLSQVDDDHFILWYRVEDDGAAYAAVTWFRPDG